MTTTDIQPSMLAQVALQSFIEADRTRVTQARRDRRVRQSLRCLDLSDDSADLSWYYVETQKIMDSNDEKIAVLEDDI